eukprot:1147242-Pleurochrysis_carterae.AAC.1
MSNDELITALASFFAFLQEDDVTLGRGNDPNVTNIYETIFIQLFRLRKLQGMRFWNAMNGNSFPSPKAQERMVRDVLDMEPYVSGVHITVCFDVMMHEFGMHMNRLDNQTTRAQKWIEHFG